jgi:membrane protease YdiL (CAAX protease family)
MTERGRLWTIATLLIALAVPNVFGVLPEWLVAPAPGPAVQWLIFLLYFGVASAVVALVLRADGVTAADIGLRRPGWITVASGVAVWAVGLLVLPVITAPLARLFGTEGVQSGLNELATMPPALRVFVAIGAGAVEELLYRGFAIERLSRLTSRRWLAGAIAATVFGLAHVSTWGLGFALSTDLPFGIYATAFYLWRRDLVANMIGHSTGLLVAMFTVVP